MCGESKVKIDFCDGCSCFSVVPHPSSHFPRVVAMVTDQEFTLDENGQHAHADVL